MRSGQGSLRAHETNRPEGPVPVLDRPRVPRTGAAGGERGGGMLEGKLPLVTGASRGIGRAIAAELARQGGQGIGNPTSQAGAKGIAEARLIAKVLDVRDAA